MTEGDGPFGRRSGEGPAFTPDPSRSPPAPAPRPPAKPPAGRASQATWILGVALVIALAYITVNSLRTEGPGSRGVERFTPLPPFAAPLAESKLEGVATVRTQADDEHPAACDVRGPGIFNVCEAAARGPLVLAFVALRSDRCERQIDLLERLRARFPDVQFAVVGIRGDREDLVRTARKRGWDMPVAYDDEGTVSIAYGVAVCPTITFAQEGGIISTTTLGEAEEAEIVRDIERIR